MDLPGQTTRPALAELYLTCAEFEDNVHALLEWLLHTPSRNTLRKLTLMPGLELSSPPRLGKIPIRFLCSPSDTLRSMHLHVANCGTLSVGTLPCPFPRLKNPQVFFPSGQLPSQLHCQWTSVVSLLRILRAPLRQLAFWAYAAAGPHHPAMDSCVDYLYGAVVAHLGRLDALLQDAWFGKLRCVGFAHQLRAAPRDWVQEERAVAAELECVMPRTFARGIVDVQQPVQCTYQESSTNLEERPRAVQYNKK
ncbi:hypothetical protein BD413DRAFT_614063 [Trametes elegans]|nr:hypothetical protein BD413DRAFT_614063 [Trametes elegans]